MRRTYLFQNGRRLDGALDAPRQGGSSPDAAKIEAAYIGFGTMLHQRMSSPESIYQRISTVARTNNLLDRQLWLNAIPTMSQWIGDKNVKALSAESLPIVTSPHEASLGVSKHDILNDRFGLYTSRIGEMGDAWWWGLDQIALVMLCAGLQGTTLGSTYDGQNLIDTDHTVRSNDTGVAAFQQSNKVAGAFSAAVYQSAWNAYLNFKDENNIPRNLRNRRMMLLHGPANRIAVRNVLQQDIATGLVQNLDKGTAEPVCCNWITAGDRKVLGKTITLTGLEWFLIPEGSTAVILQIKRDPEFLSVEEGTAAFMSGRYLYGFEAEVGAAYGLWQDVVGGIGS